MKNAISAIMIISMLFSLAACGKEGNGIATDAKNNTSVVDKSETESADTDNNVSYEKADLSGATYRIRYFGNADYEKFDVLGESSGDILADAVYKRNQSIEENLNIHLEWIKGSDDWWGYPAEVEKLILSGEDSFEIGFMELQKSLTQSLSGYYKDLNNSNTIDINDVWWYTDLVSKSQVNNNHLYYITGAFSISTILRAGSVFFNKNIWQNSYEDTGILYNMVKDETWTLDAMKKISGEIYQDINGNGVLDAEDIYGFCDDGEACINYLAMSSGLDFTTRDENGDPVLNMYNDNVLKLVDVFYDMIYDGVTSYKNDGTASGLSAFQNQNALFYVKFPLHAMTVLRDTDFEWGILPNPALNEKSGYTSAAGTVNGHCAFIPITASEDNFENSTIVLNALTVESYLNVVPECGTALRYKYSDEAADAEMVNIIYDSIDGQLLMAASASLDGIGSIFAQCVFANQLDSGGYTSFWKANESKYESLLNEIIENAR